MNEKVFARNSVNELSEFNEYTKLNKRFWKLQVLLPYYAGLVKKLHYGYNDGNTEMLDVMKSVS